MKNLILTLTPNELCELVTRNEARSPLQCKISIAEGHMFSAEDLERIKTAVAAAVLKTVAAHACDANDIVSEKNH